MKSFKSLDSVKPSGVVNVSGAKNSATRLLAASLITDEKVILKNFPTKLVDANHKKRFMLECGAQVKFDDNNDTAEILAAEYVNSELTDYEYPIRTTYLLAAGLLKRSGVAKIPYPGGCKIGSRGYDLHVLVWEKCGCKVDEKPDYLEITVDKMKPFEVDFPISTIGGTENALICGASIAGESIIRNAYISPEVEDLIAFLRSLGADITVSGNSFVKIHGKENLQGSVFEVMPDRIEALTWMIFAAISRGDIIINNVPFDSMEIPLLHLKEAGVDVFRNSSDAIVNKYSLREGKIQPFEVACGTHPGVISDMQPFYVLLALKANGISRIYDYRYPERIQYLDELIKYCPGAIEYEPGKIVVKGPVEFEEAESVSTDLRGSMALVLASLMAGGNSSVSEVQMALRGYNNLPEKLTSLGCSFRLD